MGERWLHLEAPEHGARGEGLGAAVEVPARVPNSTHRHETKKGGSYV